MTSFETFEVAQNSVGAVEGASEILTKAMGRTCDRAPARAWPSASTGELELSEQMVAASPTELVDVADLGPFDVRLGVLAIPMPL